MPSKRCPLIFLVGDVHGHFRHVIGVVRAEKPDAVLFLGDLEARRPLDIELAPILGTTEIRFIHGNHDTDCQSYYDHVFSPSIAGLNLHGRVETICGLRVGGLGGVFRREAWWPNDCPEPVLRCYQDWIKALDARRPPRDRSERRPAMMKKRERTHLSSIFFDDIKRLAGQRADLLITHEAPSCHPNGFAAIDDLAKSMGINALFHGHHHDQLDYEGDWLRLGFKAYGVGLRGISTLENEIIVRGVELDTPVPNTF